MATIVKVPKKGWQTAPLPIGCIEMREKGTHNSDWAQMLWHSVRPVELCGTFKSLCFCPEHNSSKNLLLLEKIILAKSI